MAFTRNTEAVNNISLQPDQPVISATALKVLFDQSGTDEQSYNNDVLLAELEAPTAASSLGQNNGSYGATIQSAIDTITSAGIGTIPPDGTISNLKLATDVKVGSLASLGTSDKTSVVNAINEVNLRAQFYGKYSQMSGGSAVSSSGVQTTVSFITFSAEDNDDFLAINIGANPTRITIPSGVSKVKFDLTAELKVMQSTSGFSYVTLELFKNNVLVEVIGKFLNRTTDTSQVENHIINKFTSNPIACSVGNYFEIKATASSSVAGTTAILSAGSTLKMEVLA